MRSPSAESGRRRRGSRRARGGCRASPTAVWGSSSRKKPPRSSGTGSARPTPRRSSDAAPSSITRPYRIHTRVPRVSGWRRVRTKLALRRAGARVADARPAGEGGDQAVAAALGCDRDERRVRRPGDGRLSAPVRGEQPDRVLLDDAVDLARVHRGFRACPPIRIAPGERDPGACRPPPPPRDRRAAAAVGVADDRAGRPSRADPAGTRHRGSRTSSGAPSNLCSQRRERAEDTGARSLGGDREPLADLLVVELVRRPAARARRAETPAAPRGARRATRASGRPRASRSPRRTRRAPQPAARAWPGRVRRPHGRDRHAGQDCARSRTARAEHRRPPDQRTDPARTTPPRRSQRGARGPDRHLAPAPSATRRAPLRGVDKRA